MHAPPEASVVAPMIKKSEPEPRGGKNNTKALPLENAPRDGDRPSFITGRVVRLPIVREMSNDNDFIEYSRPMGRARWLVISGRAAFEMSRRDQHSERSWRADQVARSHNFSGREPGRHDIFVFKREERALS